MSGAVVMMMGAGGLYAESSPDFVSAVGSGVSIMTPPVSVSVYGGVGPYSYAWSVGPSGKVTASSPSGQTTSFIGSFLAAGEEVTDTAICTVTDTGSGQVASTAGVVIQIIRDDV